jgi:hypothetical protein
VPVPVGVFFGAPLVAHEVEHGTHRFVWTQAVSRRCWAVTKFGLISAVRVLVETLVRPRYRGATTSWAVSCATDPCDGALVQGLGPKLYSNTMQYEPASRFWEFQGIEAGIFLALAAILIYLAVRRIRRVRRIS